MHVRVFVHAKRKVVAQRERRINFAHDVRGKVQRVNQPTRQKKSERDVARRNAAARRFGIAPSFNHMRLSRRKSHLTHSASQIQSSTTCVSNTRRACAQPSRSKRPAASRQSAAAYAIYNA